MTARCVVVVVVPAIFLASGLRAGEDKKGDKEGLNPYRTAKVGDFAVHKTFTADGKLHLL